MNSYSVAPCNDAWKNLLQFFKSWRRRFERFCLWYTVTDVLLDNKTFVSPFFLDQIFHKNLIMMISTSWKEGRNFLLNIHGFRKLFAVLELNKNLFHILLFSFFLSWWSINLSIKNICGKVFLPTISQLIVSFVNQ